MHCPYAPLISKTYDASGKVLSEYTYSTNGDRKTIKGDMNESIGYCGREGVLTETNGLIYMRARYYSVELMRFINEDIVLGDIGNSNSLNRYTYVEGNPATMIDPFGLCAEVSVESVLEAVHTTLDILGMFPGLGIGPDAINTILYIIEGDWKNAALSGIALLPAIGEIASGGKMTAKLYKALSCLKKADKIEDTISLTAKYGDTAAKVLAEYSDEMVEGVAKHFDEGIEAISKVGLNSRYSLDSYYSYNELKKMIKESGLSGNGAGFEAHHLLEKQYEKNGVS